MPRLMESFWDLDDVVMILSISAFRSNMMPCTSGFLFPLHLVPQDEVELFARFLSFSVPFAVLVVGGEQNFAILSSVPTNRADERCVMGDREDCVSPPCRDLLHFSIAPLALHNSLQWIFAVPHLAQV